MNNKTEKQKKSKMLLDAIDRLEKVSNLLGTILMPKISSKTDAMRHALSNKSRNNELETFDFSQALIYLKKGRKIARKGWSIDKNHYITNITAITEAYLTMIDVLAEDWYIVND